MLRPRAKVVEPVEDYKLVVTFNNGEKKIFDVKPYFNYPIFKALEDEKMFKTVHIGGISVEWLNGADICPDELYFDSKPIVQ